MKKILSLILFLGVFVFPLRAQTGDARRSQVPLVITGVTIVNVAAADPTDVLRAAQTVVPQQPTQLLQRSRSRASAPSTVQAPLA